MSRINQPDPGNAAMIELERRVRALETANRLTNASIKDGALTIYDASGQPRDVFGLLPDGSYGVGHYNPANDGTWVSLTAVTFGHTASTVDPEDTTSSATVSDLTNVGPTITMTIGASGAAFVLGGAYCTAPSGNTAETWVTLDGGAPLAWAWLGNQNAAGVSGDVSYGRLYTGLSAGSHTWKMQYSSSAPGLSRFQSRWLLGMPF